MARRGCEENGMRMITACFARALQKCTGRPYMGFLFIFQVVSPTDKTCNQLYLYPRVKHRPRLYACHIFSLPQREFFPGTPSLRAETRTPGKAGDDTSTVSEAGHTERTIGQAAGRWTDRRLWPWGRAVAMGVHALRRHLAPQPWAGGRRKLAGAGEHEEVAPRQRENVYASKWMVDGVFARVVYCGHGDVLAWQSGTTTRSPLGDRRTPCPARRPDDCRRGGDRPRHGLCSQRCCAG